MDSLLAISLVMLSLTLCGSRGETDIIRAQQSWNDLTMFITGIMAVPVQVVPEGIRAVNGSSTDMGCTLFYIALGDVMTCTSLSYLVDGVSPDIDTNTPDWASQLVTVRRNKGTADIPFAHVLLTFGFDTAVNLTGIEMDLFLCPDWGIGAQRIRVYVNEEYNLAFRFGRLPFLRFVQPSQSSCDTLTTVHLSGSTLSVSSYRTIHIIVDLSYNSSIQWVHIGDVRFLGEGGGPATGTCLPTPFPRSSSTSLPSSSPSPVGYLPPSSSSTSPEDVPTTTSHTSTISSLTQLPPFYAQSSTPSQPNSQSSSILHSSMPSNLVSPSAYILFPKSVFLTSPFHIKSNLFGKWAELHNEVMINPACVLSLVTDKPLPTSVPGESHCTCSEETATVIAVSAVSLLLIVTLTTVTLTQCLLIIRMRRSRDRSETYAEATNSTTKTTDVPVSLNEAYGMTKITTEEVTYEVVK